MSIFLNFYASVDAVIVHSKFVNDHVKLRLLEAYCMFLHFMYETL